MHIKTAHCKYYRYIALRDAQLQDGKAEVKQCFTKTRDICCVSASTIAPSGRVSSRYTAYVTRRGKNLRTNIDLCRLCMCFLFLPTRTAVQWRRTRRLRIKNTYTSFDGIFAAHNISQSRVWVYFILCERVQRYRTAVRASRNKIYPHETVYYPITVTVKT